jgi:NAD(P)-dependent dehydrogenase (short-subunit alcohol dehydrogenase family)
VKGKALIITGSGGISAATARLASAAGARLVVTTADEQSGWELAAETGAALWVGDIARAGAADSVLSLCLSRFARVDALFNAAGLSGRRFGDGPVHECTDEGWDLTLAHNLTAMFQMSRAVIGRMLQQQPGEDGIRGAVLNTGSVLAGFPETRHYANHAYAAAKGAVLALTRSMAAYYAPHKIRVNALSPGMVRTAASERGAQSDADLAAFLARKQPLTEGMLDAEDAARAALFLLGSGARPITGAVLAIDGGWSVTDA